MQRTTAVFIVAAMLLGMAAPAATAATVKKAKTNATNATTPVSNDYSLKMVGNEIQFIVNGKITKRVSTKDGKILLKKNQDGGISVIFVDKEGDNRNVTIGAQNDIILSGKFKKVTVHESLGKGSNIKMAEGSSASELIVKGEAKVEISGSVGTLSVTSEKADVAVKKGGKVTRAYTQSAKAISGMSRSAITVNSTGRPGNPNTAGTADLDWPAYEKPSTPPSSGNNNNTPPPTPPPATTPNPSKPDVPVITPDPAATATVATVDVTGTTGSAINSKEVTITLLNDTFKPLASDDDVATWFANLPTNLTAKIKTAITGTTTTKAVITIAGTPSSVVSAPMEITIPAASLTKGTAVKVTTNKDAKFTVAGVDAVKPSITSDLSTTEVTYTINTSATALNATATVTDSGVVSYQWYSATSGTANPATDKKLGTVATHTPDVTATGRTYYYCVVTNTKSTATGAKTATTTSAVAKILVQNAKPSAPSATSAAHASTTSHSTVTSLIATTTYEYILDTTSSDPDSSASWTEVLGNAEIFNDIDGTTNTYIHIRVAANAATFTPAGDIQNLLLVKKTV